jgi:uncharacterized protein with HEPN domain
MLDYAGKAIELATGTDRAGLESSRVQGYALIYLVTVIGEAARGVSESTRSAHPEVPWRDVVDTRNRLVHGYVYVDLDVLWDVVSNDLPALARMLKPLLEELAPGEEP